MSAKRSVSIDKCIQSYQRRLERLNVFKGNAIVQDGETTLVFRDDGGRRSPFAGAKRLSPSESKQFILKSLGGSDVGTTTNSSSLGTISTNHRGNSGGSRDDS